MAILVRDADGDGRDGNDGDWVEDFAARAARSDIDGVVRDSVGVDGDRGGNGGL